jgi:hypothetical protein
MGQVPLEKVYVFQVSTVAAYQAKVDASKTRIRVGSVENGPDVVVLASMRDVVASKAPRAPTMSEAFRQAA